MGREIKRVPVDFDWPLNKTWQGFLRPDELDLPSCPDCEGRGTSPRAEYLRALWYGHVPFRPEDNGSTPFGPDHPVVRANAERNVERAPEFYLPFHRTEPFGVDAFGGAGDDLTPTERATRREADRLAALFNGSWSHHLNADDIAALIAAGRLMDLTHTFDPVNRWQPKNPPVVPTPAEVNEWSLSGFGHDSINQWTVVRARCEREGVAYECDGCAGSGNVATDEQLAAHEAWTSTEPPEGEGWQLWETVSEGSPISPVFPTADGLIEWMTTPAAKWGAMGPWTHEQAAAFVNGPGWAPTFMSSPATGLVDGVTGVTA